MCWKSRTHFGHSTRPLRTKLNHRKKRELFFFSAGSPSELRILFWRYVSSVHVRQLNISHKHLLESYSVYTRNVYNTHSKCEMQNMRWINRKKREKKGKYWANWFRHLYEVISEMWDAWQLIKNLHLTKLFHIHIMSNVYTWVKWLATIGTIIFFFRFKVGTAKSVRVYF